MFKESQTEDDPAQHSHLDMWNDPTQHVVPSIPFPIKAIFFLSFTFFYLRSGELRTQKLKPPSGETTELKRSPFKARSRSVYSHSCYAYFQKFLPCLFLPFRSIHLHFFQNLSRFFPVLAVANTGSCVGQQNKIGLPVGCRFPCCVPVKYK